MPTLTTRLLRATEMVHRLRWLPLTHEQKVQAIVCTILPGALYGSEVSHCAQQPCQALQSAIANVLGPSSARRSQELVLELSSGKLDPDPQVQALTRKIILLLRVIAKYTAAATQTKALLSVYSTQQKKGSTLTIGPSVWDCRPDFGPIAHLTTALHQVGAYMDNDFTIHQHGEVPINIVATPWQCIRPCINQVARRSRIQQASKHRQHLQGQIIT